LKRPALSKERRGPTLCPCASAAPGACRGCTRAATGSGSCRIRSGPACRAKPKCQKSRAAAFDARLFYLACPEASILRSTCVSRTLRRGVSAAGSRLAKSAAQRRPARRSTPGEKETDGKNENSRVARRETRKGSGQLLLPLPTSRRFPGANQSRSSFSTPDAEPWVSV